MDGAFVDAELQKFFQKSSLKDWENIASQETKTAAPLEKLSWRGKDNISFRPYYDMTSDKDLLFIRGFNAGGTRKWLNLPVVWNTGQPQDANRIALDHLMQGADGVVCDVRSVDVDINALTHNIQWPHCYIGFFADKNPSFLSSLQKTVQPVSAFANGALFWDSIPKKSDLSFFINECPRFKALGIMIHESSPAQEVSDALVKAVGALEMFAVQADLEKAFRSISFSLPSDANLLETAGKLKALRMLWYQVARAYGLDHYQPYDLFLHARSLYVADGDFGPNENMLKGTFSAVAAVMGGCDGLTIEFDRTALHAIRCARNVSTILREEAFFSDAGDPLAGAWAAEAVTEAIAEKAWTLFQQQIANR